jgi:hypothetical protein
MNKVRFDEVGEERCVGVDTAEGDLVIFYARPTKSGTFNVSTSIQTDFGEFEDETMSGKELTREEAVGLFKAFLKKYEIEGQVAA